MASPVVPATKLPAKKTMPIPIRLVEGEEILRVSIIHPGIFWKSAIVFVVGILVLPLVFVLGVMILIVAGLMAGMAWLALHYLGMIVTNRRVVIRRGMPLFSETVELRLSQIESVELMRMLPGAIMGYATVLVTGTGSRVIGVPYISGADAFRAVLDELLVRREKD